MSTIVALLLVVCLSVVLVEGSVSQSVLSPLSSKSSSLSVKKQVKTTTSGSGSGNNKQRIHDGCLDVIKTIADSPHTWRVARRKGEVYMRDSDSTLDKLAAETKAWTVDEEERVFDDVSDSAQTNMNDKRELETLCTFNADWVFEVFGRRNVEFGELDSGNLNGFFSELRNPPSGNYAYRVLLRLSGDHSVVASHDFVLEKFDDTSGNAQWRVYQSFVKKRPFTSIGYTIEEWLNPSKAPTDVSIQDSIRRYGGSKVLDSTAFARYVDDLEKFCVAVSPKLGAHKTIQREFGKDGHRQSIYKRMTLQDAMRYNCDRDGPELRNQLVNKGKLTPESRDLYSQLFGIRPVHERTECNFLAGITYVRVEAPTSVRQCQSNARILTGIVEAHKTFGWLKQLFAKAEAVERAASLRKAMAEHAKDIHTKLLARVGNSFYTHKKVSDSTTVEQLVTKLIDEKWAKRGELVVRSKSYFVTDKWSASLADVGITGPKYDTYVENDVALIHMSQSSKVANHVHVKVKNAKSGGNYVDVEYDLTTDTKVNVVKKFLEEDRKTCKSLNGVSGTSTVGGLGSEYDCEPNVKDVTFKNSGVVDLRDVEFRVSLDSTKSQMDEIFSEKRLVCWRLQKEYTVLRNAEGFTDNQIECAPSAMTVTFNKMIHGFRFTKRGSTKSVNGDALVKHVAKKLDGCEKIVKSSSANAPYKTAFSGGSVMCSTAQEITIVLKNVEKSNGQQDETVRIVDTATVGDLKSIIHGICASLKNEGMSVASLSSPVTCAVKEAVKEASNEVLVVGIDMGSRVAFREELAIQPAFVDVQMFKTKLEKSNKYCGPLIIVPKDIVEHVYPGSTSDRQLMSKVGPLIQKNMWKRDKLSSQEAYKQDESAVVCMGARV